MSNFWDNVFSFLVVVGVVLLIVLMVYFPVNLLTRVKCEQTASAMGLGYEYGFFKGCLVETDEFGFVPIDQYIFVLTGK